eukprot:CAMPEP_0173289830 /NCGR_PEP_ID=MMETSP1143-20121109/11226_1 /TAXON_ID=483371 /ORGANISM="non described non described, Strain CCMP2298" /LENGTH=189 /DNA_ID=CAMNT_0014228821 /DNA_START=1061 /DNA_END=1630 /DNA_ORIENTATION=-
MVDPRDMREGASLLPEAIPPGEPLVLILAALRSPKCWLREAVGRASPTSPCRFSSSSVVFWLPEDGVPTLLFFTLWLKALIIVLIELSLRTITGCDGLRYMLGDWPNVTPWPAAPSSSMLLKALCLGLPNCTLSCAADEEEEVREMGGVTELGVVTVDRPFNGEGSVCSMNSLNISWYPSHVVTSCRGK